MYNIFGATPPVVGDNTPQPAVGLPVPAKPAVPGAPGSTPQLPQGYQQQNIPGITGGINNMVRALLAARYQNQQANPGAQPGAPGPPLNINSPAQQASMLTTPAPETFSPNFPSGLM